MRTVLVIMLVVAGCGGGGRSSDDDAASDGPVAGAAVVTLHSYTLRFPDGVTPEAPAFLAGRDGDGPFAPLAVTDGVASLVVTSGRYSVVTVCPFVDPAAPTTRVFRFRILEATVTDGVDLEVGCVDVFSDGEPFGSGTGGGTASITTTMSNFHNTSHVAVGTATCSVLDDNGSCTVRSRPGNWDVLVTEDSNMSSSGTIVAIAHVLMRRAVPIAGAALVDVDHAAGVSTANSVLVELDPVAASDDVFITTAYGSTGPTGAQALLCHTHLPRDFCPTLSVADLGPDDIQVVTGLAKSATAGKRFVRHFFRTPGTFALTLPEALAAPVVTVAQVPFRVTTRVEPLAGAQAYRFKLSQHDGTIGAWDWDATLTSAAAGRGAISFTIPDLTGVAGWDPQWDLAASRATTWSVSAVHSTASLDASTFHSFTSPTFDHVEIGLLERNAVEPVGTDVQLSTRTGSL